MIKIAYVGQHEGIRNIFWSVHLQSIVIETDSDTALYLSIQPGSYVRFDVFAPAGKRRPTFAVCDLRVTVDDDILTVPFLGNNLARVQKLVASFTDDYNERVGGGATVKRLIHPPRSRRAARNGRETVH